MKPTLLVLAAGMGSRYGGVKQIDGVGLHDECLLDFATYDAMKSGFGKSMEQKVLKWSLPNCILWQPNSIERLLQF